jgi:hypothetical protein
MQITVLINEVLEHLQMPRSFYRIIIFIINLRQQILDQVLRLRHLNIGIMHLFPQHLQGPLSPNDLKVFSHHCLRFKAAAPDRDLLLILFLIAELKLTQVRLLDQVTRILDITLEDHFVI